MFFVAFDVRQANRDRYRDLIYDQPCFDAALHELAMIKESEPYLKGKK